MGDERDEAFPTREYVKNRTPNDEIYAQER